MKKISLLSLLSMLFLISCSGMPMQGVSTANYVYRPPYTRTYESIRTGGCGYASNYGCENFYRSTSTSSYPENAFKSLRESAYNLERISDSLERMIENLENTF